MNRTLLDEPDPHGESPAVDQEQSLLLTPGHPAVLQTRPGDPGCRVVVLGVKPGEFLMVKTPPSVLAKNGLAEGQPVRLCLENEGVVCQCEATVLSALRQPLPVLFLGWPVSFQARALRRHPRVKCLIPAQVEIAGARFAAHVRDVSLGGCRVTADLSLAPRAGELKPGDLCEVRLVMNGPGMDRLAGQVCARTLTGGELSMGLAFPPGDLTRARVERFVERLLAVEELRRRTAPGGNGNGRGPQARPMPESVLADATACVHDARKIELKALSALDIQFTGSHLYEQSLILGVDGAEALIAEMPVACGLKSCPKPGMGLRGRFQEHGSYYGFMTFVTKFVTKPRPLVFLAYPKKIETLMRRKHPRVECQIPTSVANEHFRAQGFVVDVSAGGCRVLANLEAGEPIVNVMTGDMVELSLPLGGPVCETLRAKVKSFQFAGGPVTLGLVFMPERAQAPRLDGFVARMEAASR
ncbi:Cyclic di-GMP binding protein [Fundidesulfovibrio magnetotacticus]|uniref:Cyclic di-GMP binding protein n=1 Tax=Fundidesulfovibrio magnetotacticus TaxID=2730080 RepID=A0A6V8LSS7_9BACT|nr:PilZ domain-containing protein [Fundidesulfovibrio magnetotacticus]GFK94794.1 Cyclic di-GMP binding protein [Fundidesulfovibrio magnetotacticus]